MAQVDRDGEAHVNAEDLQLALLEQQLGAMERPRTAQSAPWPWLLVVAGLVIVAGLGFQTYTAYTTIASVDARSNIVTANPVVLFQDVATNGPRVGPAVETSSRSTYTRALEQFLLAGTGVCLGLTLT